MGLRGIPAGLSACNIDESDWFSWICGQLRYLDRSKQRALCRHVVFCASKDNALCWRFFYEFEAAREER